MSYQLAVNKQELRKVIKEYPGKEVKKGLDNLYKKVDKHLCDEENLLQVCAPPGSTDSGFSPQAPHMLCFVPRQCRSGASCRTSALPALGG